jgi:PAS domain S-box-containing protein
VNVRDHTNASLPKGPAETRRQAAARERAKSTRERGDLINIHLAEVIRHANDGIVLSDLTGRILYANPAFERMNGYTLRELLDRHPEDLIVDDAPTALGDEIRTTVKEHGEWTGNLLCRRRNGETYPIESRVFAIRDAQGEIIQIAAIQQDISERTRAEKALMESEEKLKTQYKSIPVPTYTWQRRGDDFVLVDYNDATVKITRGRVHEYLGKRAGDIYKGRLEILEDLRRCYAEKTPVMHEMPYLLEVTGEARHLDVKYVFVPPDLILVHTEDITERKRAEKELSASEKRFRGLFEDSPISLWEEDFSEINRHFGKLRDSGVKDFKIYFDDTPGDVEKCAAMMRVVDVNRATVDLYEAADKKKFLPHLSTGFHEGTFDLIKAELVALAEGKTVFARETVTHTFKGTRKYISLRLSVTPGCEDTLSRVYVSIVDITERKRLEEQLLHSQKMEAIGTLAGGVAHDFNNILAGIIGYVELLKIAIPKESPLLADLEAIEKLSWRSADLTKSLLAFSRKSFYHPGPLTINTLVEEALKLVGRIAGGKIRIRAELSAGILNAHADGGQLHQVIMNLCINACEAMPEGGTLTVKTEDAKPGSEFFRIHPDLKKGPYVTLLISDTGVGMDAGTHARMFEPFFTTKAEQSGTGLGLSVVSGIVERHGGCIDVESEPGKGTTITLHLPATEEEEREAPPKRVETLRGNETIMVVDDETGFRTGTARWLRGLGYTVREASSGEEAVEALKEEKDAVRLVLLDMIMKEMGGARTFAGLREIVPDLAVLICTGYSVNDSCQRLLEEGARGVIQKPFKHNELALKIREILDSH